MAGNQDGREIGTRAGTVVRRVFVQRELDVLMNPYLAHGV